MIQSRLFPDGVVLLKLPDDITTSLIGGSKEAKVDDETYHVAPLEIKTRVSDRTVSTVLRDSSTNMPLLRLSDASFTSRITKQHAFQILQQCYVLHCNIAMFVCTIEIGVSSH